MNLRIAHSTIILLFLAIVFALGASAAPAQDIEATIRVIGPARVQVEGNFLNSKYAGEKSWTFLLSYADVQNLGARIDKLTLFIQDKELAVKKFAPGIYEAAGAAEHWKYEVDLTPQAEPTAAAHVSWLAEDGGLLMPEDLLPRPAKNDGPGVSARIRLGLPAGWETATTELKNADGYYTIADISKSVLRVGKNWRGKTAESGENPVKFYTSGEWQFTDDQAAAVAQTIIAQHREIFGEPASLQTGQTGGQTAIMLLPFPRAAEPGRWRAETRGSTVVLLSSRMPFDSQGLNRLREQLRHEIFHLWIPNKLSLTGSYDWFFEGFTLYQALKSGKKMGQIRFSDLLETLGRAYTLNQVTAKDLSLIEASKRRWEGNFSFVNSRGMMVAFMCDAALLSASKGKRSLTDVFREVYKKHGPLNASRDGNEAVLAILKSYPELREIAAKYIEGREKLDPQPALLQLGLEAQVKAGVTSFRIKQKTTGRQRELLTGLGLNPLYELPEKAK